MGYFCNHYNCYAKFHRECAEAPKKINHSFHPHHPLLLIDYPISARCDLCGDHILATYYYCVACRYAVHLICGIKPPSLAIEHPLCHDHPLVYSKKEYEKSPCEICEESINGPSYSCLQCHVYFHLDCVHLSKKVNYPCHSNHPLQLVALESLMGCAEKSCFSCLVAPEKFIYHCSICNFSICLNCIKNPPPLVVEHDKTHKHPLHLFSKKIPFSCDVCGEEGHEMPYACVLCAFLIHGECIYLPRVINMNRHDHRLSFTHHIGRNDLICGVCYQTLSQYHGAYSCSVCPYYAAHSQCVLRNGVWDGFDLEGIPDVTENIAPFEVVGDGLIVHFSHKGHILRLHKDNNVTPSNRRLRCEACMYPVGFQSIYVCDECGYILHEKCAYLPTKKRLIFDTAPYTLKSHIIDFIYCRLCRTLSGGFLYISQSYDRGYSAWRYIDVHCVSLYEPFNHKSHLHSLYFHENKSQYCDGCHDVVDSYVLSCNACDFVLCFYCASLPEKICHMNEEHPLTLYFGEKVNNNKWCDRCEYEIEPCKLFYMCYDSGITLHARCVLGDFSRLELGKFVGSNWLSEKFKVVPNNHNTRPLCSQCQSRCKLSIILKQHYEENAYICDNNFILWKIWINTFTYDFILKIAHFFLKTTLLYK
ncbi:hypothetical protein Bca52824_036207 [Brassica carinata]|uniref:Phorbol-ester/DAG-type domain-containing protein n=1 Tax=Brassica carinata TaxID=52824 RepID=A0A8X7S4B2_BRACI|nr:hypothetical protein Bca52824_036207 [Brassica carinata]